MVYRTYKHFTIVGLVWSVRLGARPSVPPAETPCEKTLASCYTEERAVTCLTALLALTSQMWLARSKKNEDKAPLFWKPGATIYATDSNRGSEINAAEAVQSL